MDPQPVTAKQFAAEFSKYANDPTSPAYPQFHEAETAIADKYPNGVSSRQLWDELTSSKYGPTVLKTYRLVPDTTAPAAVIGAASAANPAQPPSMLDTAIVNPAKRAYSALMEGSGKFANTLANVAEVVHAVSPAGIASHFSPAPALKANPVADFLRQSGREASAIGAAAKPTAENFTDPIYEGIGGAVPTIAQYAPTAMMGPAAPLGMAAIGAAEEADKGPVAAVQGAASAALMGEALGAINKIPGLKKFLVAGGAGATTELIQGLFAGLSPEEILKRMVGSGTTMAGLVAANPASALGAIGEAVVRVKSMFSAEPAKTIAAPVTAAPPIRPGEAPAAAPQVQAGGLSADAQKILTTLQRDTIRNPKAKVTANSAAQVLGTKDQNRAIRAIAELRTGDTQWLNEQHMLVVPKTAASATAAPPPVPGGLPDLSKPAFPAQGTEAEKRAWAHAQEIGFTVLPPGTAMPPRPMAGSEIPVETAPPPVAAPAVQPAMESVPSATEPSVPLTGPVVNGRARDAKGRWLPSRPATAATAPATTAAETSGISPEDLAKIEINNKLIAELQERVAAGSPAPAAAAPPPEPVSTGRTLPDPAVMPEADFVSAIVGMAPAGADPIKVAEAARNIHQRATQVQAAGGKPPVPTGSPSAPAAPVAPTPIAEVPPPAAVADAGAVDIAAAKARLAAFGKSFLKGETGTWYFDQRRPLAQGEPAPEQIFRDLAAVGKDIVKTTGRNFEVWRKEMVSSFGDWVDQFLAPLWRSAGIDYTTPPPVGVARPSAGLVPPEAARTAGSDLPPAQPPYLEWSKLFAGKEPPTPQRPVPSVAPEVPPTPEDLARVQEYQKDLAARQSRSDTERAAWEKEQEAGRTRDEIAKQIRKMLTAFDPKTIEAERRIEEKRKQTEAKHAKDRAEQARLIEVARVQQEQLAREHEADVERRVEEGRKASLLRSDNPPALPRQPGAVAGPPLPAEPTPGEALEDILTRPRTAEPTSEIPAGPRPIQVPPSLGGYSVAGTAAGYRVLKQAGFTEREQTLPAPGSRKRGPVLQAQPGLAERIPYDEVWVKPVSDGTIEIQRTHTNEFTATKHFTKAGPLRERADLLRKSVAENQKAIDGHVAEISERAGTDKPIAPLTAKLFAARQRGAALDAELKEVQTQLDEIGSQPATTRGMGIQALVDYLNRVQEQEAPLRQGQKASQSRSGTKIESVRAVTEAPPAEPAAATSEADRVRDLERSTRGARTSAELASVIARGSTRMGPQPAQKVPDTPELVAKELSYITGGKTDFGSLSKAKSDVIASRPFRIQQNREGSWTVMRVADGGTTNLTITKKPGAPFFHIKVGENLMAMIPASAEPAAMSRAVDLAEKLSTGKRRPGRPAADQPELVVTPTTGTPPKEPAPVRAQPAPSKLAKIPEASPFKIVPAGKGSDAWQVMGKKGGYTDVHIDKLGNSYKIFLGAKQIGGGFNSLSAAKIEAESIAARQVEAETVPINAPPVPEAGVFKVPGAGTYVPLGMTADGKSMQYRFTPDATGKTVTTSMDLASWVRTKDKGVATGETSATFKATANPPKQPAKSDKQNAQEALVAELERRARGAQKPVAEEEGISPEDLAKIAENARRIAEIEAAQKAGPAATPEIEHISTGSKDPKLIKAATKFLNENPNRSAEQAGDFLKTLLGGPYSKAAYTEYAQGLMQSRAVANPKNYESARRTPSTTPTTEPPPAAPGEAFERGRAYTAAEDSADMGIDKGGTYTFQRRDGKKAWFRDENGALFSIEASDAQIKSALEGR